MKNSYILNTNSQARDRLTLQHALYVQSSMNLLEKAGVSKGMKGLEIGCGSGAMTKELLQLVGDEGDLLSIDFSQEQVDFVKEETKTAPQVRVKCWDVNKLTDLGEEFDFIYCRMVLHHLADAHHALLQIKQCLKPGGVLICEEPSIFDANFCSPTSPAYEKTRPLIRACFEGNRCDFNIAQRLELDCISCDLTVMHHSLFQPLLRTVKEKKILFMALNDITPQLLELKLVTQDEIDALSKDLFELAHAQNTMSWIRMHQIIARR